MATSNLQAELRELREQMSALKETLNRQASRGSYDLRNRASEALEGASHAAGAVADYARDRADTVASAARRHPAATASTALLTLGVIGGLIGYLIATSTPPQRHSRWGWN